MSSRDPELAGLGRAGEGGDGLCVGGKGYRYSSQMPGSAQLGQQ